MRAAPDIGSFMADERRVRQVLFNLLSNAVGFSPAGRNVRLTASGATTRSCSAVTDQGPGIPAEIARRVFDRFETHPLGSQHRGAGLGLSIVRSFVELHGGTVKLESAVGRGTTVTCVFPIEQAAGRRRRHEPHDRGDDRSSDRSRANLSRCSQLTLPASRSCSRTSTRRGGSRSTSPMPEAGRPRHAVGRSRRRQDHVRARADPPSRRR